MYYGYIIGQAMILVQPCRMLNCRVRVCLTFVHRGGGTQIGEVTCLGVITYLMSIQSPMLIGSHLHDRWGDHNHKRLYGQAGFPT